jgi:putative transposase
VVSVSEDQTTSRIFPNSESCLRLARALRVETHKAWLEDNRHLNMTLLAEQKKALLRTAL